MKRAVLTCLLVLSASWLALAQAAPTKVKKAKKPKAAKAVAKTTDPVAASNIFCPLFIYWFDGNDGLFYAEMLIENCWPLSPYFVWGDIDTTECPDDCADGCGLSSLSVADPDAPVATGHQPRLFDLHASFSSKVPSTFPLPGDPTKTWRPRDGFQEVKSGCFQIVCPGRTRPPFYARLCESILDAEAAGHPEKGKLWRVRFGLETATPDAGAKVLKGVKDPNDPRRCTVKWDGREFTVFTVNPL